MKNNLVMIALLVALGFLAWERINQVEGGVIVPSVTPTSTIQTQAPVFVPTNVPPVAIIPTSTPFYVAPTVEIVPVHIRSTSEPEGEKGSHETGRTDHRSP